MRTWQVADVEVYSNRRTNIVLRANEALISPRSTKGPWQAHWGHSSIITGGVWGQRENDLLFLEPARPVESIPEAVYVGMLSPHNWYHWLCNTLPSIFLSRDLPIDQTVPLLLHADSFPDEKWGESFSALALSRPVKTIRDGEKIRVNRLYCVDSPVDRGPFPHSLQDPVSVHQPALAEFRAFLLESMGPLPAEFPTKLMLTRSPHSARQYNQNEILKIAEERGYTPVMLEDYGFREIVGLFHNAEKIIGPHGASFANMLFCQPGTKLLQWQAVGSERFNDYSSLSIALELDYKVLRMTHGQEGDLVLDPIAAGREIAAL